MFMLFFEGEMHGTFLGLRRNMNRRDYRVIRLATRGNNVSIYSIAHKSLGPLGQGVHSLETILRPEQQTSDQTTVDLVFWFLEMMPEVFEGPHECGFQYLMHTLNDETFQAVLNTPWDVVILDEMFATAQGAMALKIREKFDSKLATFATTDFSSQFSIYRGFSRNPVTSPNYYTKGYDMMNYDVTSFAGRLSTIRDLVYEQYYINIASNAWLKRAGEVLDVYTSYESIFEASHFTFTDFPSRYGHPSPHGHDLIYVGEHCQKSKQLGPELKAFVDDPPSKGTIYIAFGSIVNWAAAPSEVVSAFFEVINSFNEYRFIFSYGGPEVSVVKPHVKILRWAPQNDILNHKKTVLFFTHGGLKSVKEGVCSSTPMLFLPFFADQPRNALFARDLGIAELIYKKNVTAEELRTKIARVLSDTGFKSRVEEFNRQFLDHVVDPLDYGSQWVDRLRRITDSQSMYYKNRGRLLSWISFLYIDILFAVFVSCCLL